MKYSCHSLGASLLRSAFLQPLSALALASLPQEVYITLDVAEAQATVEADRVRILADIEAATGGWERAGGRAEWAGSVTGG
jgi:hypothetical protein